MKHIIGHKGLQRVF